MYSFSFVQPAGKNFVPGWKICDFAKNNRLKYGYIYDEIVVYMQDGAYKYHHYSIGPLDNGLEQVTVVMEKGAQTA
jgi:hypothetical protein